MPILGNVGAGTDADAIHDNEAGEINAIAEKVTPVATDLLVIEDSADSNNKKKVQVGNLPGGGGTDADAIHDNVAGEIDAIAAKATPVGADQLLIEDSAAANAKKKIAISSLDLPGQDSTALHDNVAGEIIAITEKVSPVGADVLLIEDSTDSNNKKRVQITNLPGGADADAIHDNVAGEIDAITAKATPVGADQLLIEDSAAANAKKKITISSLDLPGQDSTALHDNVAGEINAVTEKVTPVSADLILIEDSADSNNKKKVQVGNLPGTGAGGDTDAIHDNVASEISAITAKATPVAGDFLIIEDSEDSNNKKSITIGDLPSGGGGGTISVAEDIYKRVGYVSKNGSNQLLFKTEEESATTTLFTYEEPSGDHSRFTFSGPCYFEASLSTTGANADQKIQWYDSTDTLKSASIDGVNSAGDNTNSLLVGEAVAGDYLVAFSTVSPTDDADETHFTCKAIQKGLTTEPESIGYNGFTSKTGADEVLFKTLVQDTSSTFVTATNTTHTRYTFDAVCDFIAMGSGAIGVDVNIFWFNSSDVQIASSRDSNSSGTSNIGGRAAVGDYVLVTCSNPPTDAQDTSFHITCYPVSDALRTTHLMMFSDNDGFNSSRYLLQNQIVDTAGGLVTKAETGSYTRFTFNSACIFTAGTSYNGGNMSAGQNCGVELYDSGDTLRYSGLERAPAGEASASLIGLAAAGDYIVFKSDLGTSSNDTNTNFWVYASDPGTTPGGSDLGVVTSDPGSPLNGDYWINVSDKKHKFKYGGVIFESATYTAE